MRRILRDLIAPFRGVDRRDLWILLYAPVGMTAFVAMSQGGRHPIFEALFASRFGADYLADSTYHWWKIVFYHVGVLVAFGVVPALIVKAPLRGKLADYGVTLGDWRWGLKFLALWIVLMGPGSYVNALQPAFQAEYPLCRCDLLSLGPGKVALWIAIYGLYYVGWEFFFRGFIQMGIAPRTGAFVAILMQTLPSTIIHVGKPLGETAAAILGGLIFGAAAWRTRSILWPLLAHWILGALTEVFANMAQRG
jgi:membrane protease YdiL (CAAX protease family)